MHIDIAVPMAYVDDDASSGSGDDVNMLDGHKRQAGLPSSSFGGRKRGRKATGGAIVDAMLEIAAASKMRASAIMKNEDKFSINKCIKVLDEMQGVDERIYFLALDLFEDHPNAREVFISLKDEKRLPWLQGKCDTPISMDDIDLELDEMELVAAAAGYYYYSCLTKQPSRCLSPRRCEFMTEVLNGHDDFCREMLRMDKHVFHKLCDILRQRAMLRDTAGIQRDIVIAACVLHNFIRREERNDWLFSSVGGAPVDELSDLDELPDIQLLSSIQEQLAFSLRDSIAAAMWDDFLNKWDEWSVLSIIILHGMYMLQFYKSLIALLVCHASINRLPKAMAYWASGTQHLQGSN
ncbi:hypothetical protein SESBI_16718 [Sesbania bispinosa]|nr:hypothetical protein SESBI_16718 [Sesbania bispinosa]